MSLRTRVFTALILAVAAAGPSINAQQVSKIAKIGYLAPSTPASVAHLVEAFRQGLRELGYVEGKTVVLEARYAEARVERLPELARELVGLKVDVIVASTDAVIAAVKRETRTIPIVMAPSSDPAQWEAAGAAEGSRPRALPRGVPLEPRRPGQFV